MALTEVQKTQLVGIVLGVYPAGSYDGLTGPKTRAAEAALDDLGVSLDDATEEGLTAEEIIRTNVSALLSSGIETLSPAEIKQLQASLTFLEIDTGRIDGVLGTRTRGAVAQYEAAQNNLIAAKAEVAPVTGANASAPAPELGVTEAPVQPVTPPTTGPVSVNIPQVLEIPSRPAAPQLPEIAGTTTYGPVSPEALQTVLASGGYYTMRIDGNFGPGSRAALLEAIHDNPDHFSSFIDDPKSLSAAELIEHLTENQEQFFSQAYGALQQVNQSYSPRNLQSILNVGGYGTRIDGDFGNQTRQDLAELIKDYPEIFAAIVEDPSNVTGEDLFYLQRTNPALYEQIFDAATQADLVGKFSENNNPYYTSGIPPHYAQQLLDFIAVHETGWWDHGGRIESQIQLGGGEIPEEAYGSFAALIEYQRDLLNSGHGGTAVTGLQFLKSSLEATIAANAEIGLNTPVNRDSLTALGTDTLGPLFENFLQNPHASTDPLVNHISSIWAAFPNTSGQGTYDNVGLNGTARSGLQGELENFLEGLRDGYQAQKNLMAERENASAQEQTVAYDTPPAVPQPPPSMIPG